VVSAKAVGIGAGYTRPLPPLMSPYDPDRWLEQLRECRHLPEADMKALCAAVRARLAEESNIQPVSAPVTICGDIHGQFWDLLELLRKGGDVPGTSYIFMVRSSAVNVRRNSRADTRGRVAGRLRGQRSL
jgi:hypothetical protein